MWVENVVDDEEEEDDEDEGAAWKIQRGTCKLIPRASVIINLHRMTIKPEQQSNHKLAHILLFTYQPRRLLSSCHSPVARI